MKRHYDKGNSYKRKHLVGSLLYRFRGLVYYHHIEAHGGMYGAKAVAEYCNLFCKLRSGEDRMIGMRVMGTAFDTSKPTPGTHFLQQFRPPNPSNPFHAFKEFYS